MVESNEIRKYMEQLSNEDLIEILLKHDERQWRPEVFEIVGAILGERGVSAGKDLKFTVGPENALDETEGLNLITVAEYVSHLDAETDRLILEGEGVKAWIFEEDSAAAEGIPPSVQLKVCAEDWRSAMERLASEDLLPPDLPDDLAAPPCPKCGSRKVVEKEEMTQSSTESKWLSYCASCGHQWSEIK